MAEAVANVVAIVHPAERRATWAGMKEEAPVLRMKARLRPTSGRVFDAVAKFGGGSLLTATLLLTRNGQAAVPVLAGAGLTLLLFVAGTILPARSDRRAAQLEFDADWIEAVPQQMER